MSTYAAELTDIGELENESSYRAVSRGAVFSLVLALFSIPLAYVAALLSVAGLAMVIGVAAFLKIRKHPQELTGARFALLGAAVGALVLVIGSARHAYIYAHEVKEGYSRISFADLQPLKEKPELPVPPQALELDGEKVFVKGYVYPDGQQDGIRRFVLVPDMGTCCFGGQPKLTDMIEVTMRDPLRVAYSRRRLKLHGILKVDTRLKPVSGLQGVYYQLDCDQVD